MSRTVRDVEVISFEMSEPRANDDDERPLRIGYVGAQSIGHVLLDDC
jgi:hypothetical protein